MKAELIFALIGAIVGATIGQLKGSVMAGRLASLLPACRQKIFTTYFGASQTDTTSD